MQCPTNGLTFVTKEATFITPTKTNEREERRKERERDLGGVGEETARNAEVSPNEDSPGIIPGWRKQMAWLP